MSVAPHWTRISSMGAKCLSCRERLAPVPDTVWSTDRGLYCDEECAADHEQKTGN